MVADWDFEPILKRLPKLENSVLIVGLPGIGNVGKVAVDFLIDELKAKPLFNIFSYELPNSVFVNEDNLVELPEIVMYYVKKGAGKKDLLILTGDVQPSEEQSSYKFCMDVIDKCSEFGLSSVITLGGIGLAEVPEKPLVFCTGNDKKFIADFVKGTKINKNLYGAVGPIIGVSGIMVGLCGKIGIPSVCVLSQTLGHPAYLGVKGSRELVKVLKKKLSLKIKISNLDKEIEELEKEVLAKTEELSSGMRGAQKRAKEHEANYIG